MMITREQFFNLERYGLKYFNEIKETLSDDTIGLLTALSYVEENEIYLTETYENLATCILGFDTVINGLKEIHELGFDLIPQHKFRKLVIDKNKVKYNGMMR